MAGGRSAFRHLDEVRPWDDRSQLLELVDLIHEAPDVGTFVFQATDRSWFRYMPGQCLTLELPTPQGVVHRTYTLSSTPSRPWSIAITAKAQASSIGTRWMLDQLKPGDRLKAFGPAGQFSFHLHPAEKYLFLSAGSGVTPMMSMLRYIHDLGRGTDIVFLNCTKRPSEIIFRTELETLAERMKQLDVAWVVEERDPGQPWYGHRGRLTPAILQAVAPDFLGREVFCCGPAPFMAAVRAMLAAAGFAMDHYHEESFQPVAEPEPTGDANTPEARSAVLFSFSEVEVEGEEGETILQLARKAGLNIPTGCTMGLCGTCKVQKVEGETMMSHQGGIREEDEAAGYVLACCTRPVGRVVIDA